MAVPSEVVGEAARRIGRDKVRIISKVFKPSMSHDKMIKACEDSLQRLVPITWTFTFYTIR